MIHAYASAPHYARHIAPVWRELRARGQAGKLFALGGGAVYLRERGFDLTESIPRHPDAPVLIASMLDSTVARAPYIYLEHGAGQSYPGCRSLDGHGSYGGGRGHERAVLFLAPNQTVADRWRSSYPQTPVAVVGCPALDAHHGRERPRPIIPQVGFAFHWDGRNMCPEIGTAFFEFRDAIRRLSEQRSVAMSLVGHGHPRAGPLYEKFFADEDIAFVPDPDEFMASLSLLVADNTSLMYEAAALGIPVLALNASFYRQDVEHGMRFWDTIPGMECLRPDDLEAAIVSALLDPPQAQERRRRAARVAYAYRDGRSSERAVDAILALF